MEEPTILEVRDVLVNALHQFDMAMVERNMVERQRYFASARQNARQANDEIRLLAMREKL